MIYVYFSTDQFEIVTVPIKREAGVFQTPRAKCFNGLNPSLKTGTPNRAFLRGPFHAGPVSVSGHVFRVVQLRLCYGKLLSEAAPRERGLCLKLSFLHTSRLN